MRLLVTGGCGFIGSNFIRMALRDDPESFICNADKLTYAGNPANLARTVKEHPGRYVFAKADIADHDTMLRLLEEHSLDGVVNFAAESHVDRSIIDPAPFIRTNVLGAQTLLAAASKHGVSRYVHVSTDEVYGSLGEKGAFSETTPLAPNSPYSASKAAADLICRAWHKTYAFPVIVTRCSNNYGPCQFPEKLIPFMYLRAMRDESLPLYGDGGNVRDWIHVEDHCRGILLALLKGRPGAVYNFGGNAERDNLAVVREILRFCGKPESLVRFVADRPGHDRRYAMEYSLAAEELGFSPSRSFEEGLGQTLRWYADNPEWVRGVTSGAYLSFIQEWYGDKV
ncbi:MAG: dTDP-glucose 4,6-dehydratase [Desulfovibrio sp.]|nr:dTDP-glucose 4,6-dehydratase [Desulfovibrio sp.]